MLLICSLKRRSEWRKGEDSPILWETRRAYLVPPWDVVVSITLLFSELS